MNDLVVAGDDLDLHYSATVLADSVSPGGVRLTTFKLVYPRFIHSEMMTHRDKSRNAASSRAIPTERLIEQVRIDPFVPANFNKRVKGMGVGDRLLEEDERRARLRWVAAANNAAESAQQLLELDVDKSRANRLLEPFLWYTAIFSGTEWENMLTLRDHPAAQPEIQAIARCVRRGFEASEPEQLGYGDWHLPLVTDEEKFEADDNRVMERSGLTDDDLKKISASRCARISFDRDDDEERETTIARGDVLMANGHLSPFEHVARPFSQDEVKLMKATQAEIMTTGLVADVDYAAIERDQDAAEFCGNFRGWVQFRKEIPNESRFDRLMEGQEAKS